MFCADALVLLTANSRVRKAIIHGCHQFKCRAQEAIRGVALLKQNDTYPSLGLGHLLQGRLHRQTLNPLRGERQPP